MIPNKHRGFQAKINFKASQWDQMHTDSCIDWVVQFKYNTTGNVKNTIIVLIAICDICMD